MSADTAQDVTFDRIRDLLGPGLTEAGKTAWLNAPCVFLDGRVPAEVIGNAVDEVAAAVEQYNAGDFA